MQNKNRYKVRGTVNVCRHYLIREPRWSLTLSFFSSHRQHLTYDSSNRWNSVGTSGRRQRSSNMLKGSLEHSFSIHRFKHIVKATWWVHASELSQAFVCICISEFVQSSSAPSYGIDSALTSFQLTWNMRTFSFLSSCSPSMHDTLHQPRRKSTVMQVKRIWVWRLTPENVIVTPPYEVQLRHEYEFDGDKEEVPVQK